MAIWKWLKTLKTKKTDKPFNEEFENIKYYVPDLKRGRFEYVTAKIAYAKANDHDELEAGYRVVLNAEFKIYKVK